MSTTTISWAATALPPSASFAGLQPDPHFGHIALPGATFNTWWGCTPCSRGCKNCYAKDLSRGLPGYNGNTPERPFLFGSAKVRRFLSARYWREPLGLNARAVSDGWRRRVFACSMSDLFEEIPTGDHFQPDPRGQMGDVRELMDEARKGFWSLVEQCEALDFMVLTKRPSAIRRLLPTSALALPNLWLGFTAEDQKAMNERWRLMRRYAEMGKCLFISVEPMLRPITLPKDLAQFGKKIMVIVGGESGHSARPFDPAWALDLLHQCRSLRISFHMKQYGSNSPLPYLRSDPHGTDPSRWDPTLWVREWCDGIPIHQTHR